MGRPVAVSKDTWKKKRDDLSSKRETLFRKYSHNPNDLSLALEIRTIDDEIAEYTDRIREQTLSERKSKPTPVVPSKN
jgi:hypothetical protein